MALPASQRFKAGSDRRYSGSVTAAGNPVDLTAQSDVSVKVRKQNHATADAITLDALNVTDEGTFEVDLSELSPGLYYLELHYTDSLGRIRKPPENLDTPGIPIEIYPSVG